MRCSVKILVLTLYASCFAFTGTSGCSSDGAASVPSSAMLAAEGSRRLPYTTTAPGTLYVYDKTGNTLVYCGEVAGGRQILVDPDANRITADNDVLQEKKLTSGHTYRIFFEPRGVH